MRNSWYKKGRVLSLVVAGILGAGMFGAAYAVGQIGIDFDNSTNCPSTAGQVWGAGDVGMVNDFTIFMTGLDPIVVFGCTFCVNDRNKVSNESWVYGAAVPAGWDQPAIKNTVDHGGIVVSASLTAHWPDYKCYYLNGTDFSAANPITLPAVLGTLTWTVAAEGPIYWLIDGPNSGYFTQLGATGDFSGAGMICPDLTSTQPGASWGDIKQLFR